MIEYGSLLLAESSSERLSHRIYPDDNATGECRQEWLGFRMHVGGDILAFPFELWFPTRTGSGGLPAVRDCVGFMPRIVLNGDGTIDVFRAGLPKCRFVGGFCERTQETLRYEQPTGHYVLESLDGVRYEFGSNAGANPILDTVTFPSGVKYICIDNGSLISFNVGNGSLVLTVALSDAWSISSVLYKALVGGSYRTLFSMSYDPAASGSYVRGYSCQWLDPQNVSQSFTLELHIPAQANDPCPSFLGIPGYGAPGYHESVSACSGSLVASSFQHDRLPTERTESLSPLESHSDPFLVLSDGAGGSEDKAFFSFSGSGEDRRLLSRFSLADGLCAATQYDGGMAVESVSSVPFVPFLANGCALNLNAFFDEGGAYWSLGPGASIQDVDRLPDSLAIWPACRPDLGRSCAVIPSGSALAKNGGTRLLSDAPYAFCLLLAADAATCSSPVALTLTATIGLNGGGSVQRSRSYGEGSLSPGHPTLIFMDLSTAEGATGYSLSLSNAGSGAVAVAMAALFPVPVSRLSRDPSTGLALERTVGTSYESNKYSGDLPIQTVGDLSGPLQSFDGSRRPVRAVSSDGSVASKEYVGDSSRVSSSSLRPADGGLAESLFRYTGPWSAPSEEASPYGWNVSRSMGYDGSVASATANGKTSFMAIDSRRRPVSVSLSWNGGSISHLASYSAHSSTLSVDQVSGASVQFSESLSGASYSDVRGGEAVSSSIRRNRYPESASYSGSGSLAYDYGDSLGDIGVWLPVALSRGGASGDQVSFSYGSGDGGASASVGLYSRQIRPSPSLHRGTDDFAYAQTRYARVISASDPAFLGRSERVDVGDFGEVSSSGAPTQEPRCSDYPSVFGKASMAGSACEDIFATASIENPPSGVGFDLGVPYRSSASIWSHAIVSGTTLTFVAMLRFQGQTVLLKAQQSLSAYEIFRYQGGWVSAANGSVSAQRELTGWHCLALAVGADGSATLFLDDARVNFSLSGFLLYSLSLTASQNTLHSIVAVVPSRWGDEALYEAVRDCLAMPIPSASPRSYSSVSSHSATPSDTLASRCDFDGTVLLGTTMPSVLSGHRRIHPTAPCLASRFGGPRRSPRFRYDAGLGRKCLVCSGDLLAYPTSGKTVCLRLAVKPFAQLVDPGRRCLFSIGREGGPKVSCYLLGGTIRLETLGVAENTGISLPEGVWTYVSFRFVTSQSSSASSSPETIAISYGVSTNLGSFSNGRTVSYSIDVGSPLYVGTAACDAVGYPAQPLLGLVGELWLTPRDYSLVSLSSISSRLKTARFEARLDSFGRVCSCAALREGAAFVEESFEYDAPSADLDQTSPKARQTANLRRHVVRVNGQSVADESLARDASTGELTSLFGQGVEYYGSGFLKAAMGEAFSYRPDGGISSRTKSGVTRTYDYDSSSRLTGVSGVCSISYPTGSLFPSSVQRVGSSSLSFSYFAAGKVRSVSVGGQSYVFDYDESGRRFRKSLPGGGARLYRYDGDSLAYESESGSWAIAYGYDSLGRPAWLDHFDSSGRRRYFFIVDAIGRISKVLDDAGAVALSYSYDALGLPTVQDSTAFGLSLRSSLRYKGYVYDHESGLYFLGFRFYDPSIGRFLSPDSPSNLDFSTPGGLSLYAHCFNDPITYADPSGHMPDWGWWVLGGIAVLLSFVAVVATAGGMVPALTAIWSASCGIAFGSAATTVASFAFVGMASIYVGALAYNAINIATAQLRGSTYEEAIETMLGMGRNVFFTTISFGITCGVAGYASYADQLQGLSHSWTTERKHYLQKHPGDSGMVLHHPYGRFGANIKYYYAVTPEEHREIHHLLGYGNGGGFWQYRPWFNWWNYLSGRL